MKIITVEIVIIITMSEITDQLLTSKQCTIFK